MMNVKRDENSPAKIIYGRPKRFRTNEIDARKRLRLREEEGGRAGKTKTTWKGEPTNILKRKHRLKEGKGFTRVGWILDYGLRAKKKKGWAGGKRKQLRI